MAGETGTAAEILALEAELRAATLAGDPVATDRLLAAGQAYADMETRWLKTAADVLAWMMLVDRLLAGTTVP